VICIFGDIPKGGGLDEGAFGMPGSEFLEGEWDGMTI